MPCAIQETWLASHNTLQTVFPNLLENYSSLLAPFSPQNISDTLTQWLTSSKVCSPSWESWESRWNPPLPTFALLFEGEIHYITKMSTETHFPWLDIYKGKLSILDDEKLSLFWWSCDIISTHILDGFGIVAWGLRLGLSPASNECVCKWISQSESKWVVIHKKQVQAQNFQIWLSLFFQKNN